MTPTQDPFGYEEATPGRSSEGDLSPDRPDSTAAVPAETTDDRTDATWAIVLRRTVLVAVGLLVLAAAGLMIDGLTDSAEASDVVVVLGSEVLADGSPSARLAARLDAAIGVYEAGLVDAVIVSGGVGRSGHGEAVAMADYLVAEGVPNEVIVIDGEGVNTRATAVNAAAIMAEHGWTSAIVATQHFHISRSRLAMRQEGIDRVTTVHADHTEFRDVYSLIREIPAYARYLLG